MNPILPHLPLEFAIERPHHLGVPAQVVGRFLGLAHCAIFAPQVTPFRRLVVLVLLVVLVISVYRAPAILQAVEPLLR